MAALPRARPNGSGIPVHGARAAAGYAAAAPAHRPGRGGRRLLEPWYGRCTEGRGTPVLAAIRTAARDPGRRSPSEQLVRALRSGRDIAGTTRLPGA